jgi:hypothetical protein
VPCMHTVGRAVAGVMLSRGSEVWQVKGWVFGLEGAIIQ